MTVIVTGAAGGIGAATAQTLRDAAVFAERLQVQRRAHVAVPAPDRLIEVGHRHADVRGAVRQAPQRIEKTNEIAPAHEPIVADRATRRAQPSSSESCHSSGGCRRSTARRRASSSLSAQTGNVSS